MVPFGPCPTVPAGERHPGRVAPDGSELDPRLFARASRLTAVSMDMTGGYAKSVREHAPQAEIVIDNYHVVALATKALDEVRREHWNELRHAGESDAAKEFKDDRWSLLKNPEDLTDRQAATLAAIQTAGGKVARAWAMKEMVRAIFAPGLTRRGRREADRPAPRPPVPLPPGAVHPPRPHDPQTPRGDPRRPPPGLEQRPRGGAQQQGETDRPPRLRVPLRPRRARAHPPRLRTGHTHTPTRPIRCVTSPTIIHGEPLFRGRVRTADVRVQSDADAEFVVHAAADIAALLDQLGHTQQGSTQADRRRRRRRAGRREAKVALSPQADRQRRHRQAGRDRRTVTDWLRRLPRE